ncbi:MAG: GTP 3',8-cyclase MoaA [Candidatus Zixiibacteriota bacterium]
MRYLRVSLLKACNFNCFYCRPPSINDYRPRDFTDPGKFKRSISLLLRLGVEKVRFTGGEPTLYRRLPDLIAHTKEINSKVTTALTTNGRLLTKLAPELATAGLDSVNISLDTVSEARFKRITTVGCFDKVVAGIDVAKNYFRDVKLNCVVIKGVNDDEIGQMVDFAQALDVDIRFIEYMRTKYSATQDRGYLPAKETVRLIRHKLYPVATDIASPARYYSADDLTINIGFINSVSQPFCDFCNRIRLTSDGDLRTCLFSSRSFNLFDLLDRSPESAADEIKRFVAGKVFAGSPAASSPEEYLPSFSEIGG